MEAATDLEDCEPHKPGYLASIVLGAYGPLVPIRDIREFFYVDVDRVRSLLAQLQDGVVDAIKSETTHTAEAGAEARVFGIGGRGGYGRETRLEESRSQQDLTFVAFEELCNEEGLISDIGADFASPALWESGQVHASLREGQLVRLTCDVQVLDGGLFGDRVNRFQAMARALVGINGSVPQLANAKQLAKQTSDAVDAVMGIPATQMNAISEFVQAFVGDSVSVRVLPCGSDFLEFAFAGALLGRQEYLQAEREHLFSRYGNGPSKWTAVLQVAAIPSDPSTADSAAEVDSLRESGDISRAGMERVASNLLQLMESIGLVEGPRWPSVSVTPLGIYRLVPPPEAHLRPA